jgi:class 3 adenylate cyclase
VAVAVIRDGLRPRLPPPEEQLAGAAEFEELITSCWHHDPTIRPTFLEIMTRLSSMHGEASNGAALTSRTSTSSSSGGHSGGGIKKSLYGSWTLPSGTSGSASTGSSSSNSSKGHSSSAEAAAGGRGAVRAPQGEVAIVFTDITRAASLWEFNPAAMRDATLAHNGTLRSALAKHSGYEVVFIRDRNSGEGSFCMAFQHTVDALSWCSEVQKALLNVEWPEALMDHPGAAEEWGDTDDRFSSYTPAPPNTLFSHWRVIGCRVLFKGLRVRMGVHVGTPKMVRDPMTRRVEFFGPTVNAAARITALTHGGQIVMSQEALENVKSSHADWMDAHQVTNLGKFEMPDMPHGAHLRTLHKPTHYWVQLLTNSILRNHLTGSKLFELRVNGLEGRFFGGVTQDSDGVPSTNSNTQQSGASHGSGSAEGSGREQVEEVVGEGMAFKEDNFLTSANLCRWIIDYHEIQVGKQVGLGSYGVVFRGKWKGVDVAVKRFIKQKLDERRMLEFRAEMAFLSELHHPNIVLFIGTPLPIRKQVLGVLWIC